MVPIPIRGAWHEEQIDELFASLLGKGFEANDLAPATNALIADQESQAMQGFRVFG
jgi:protein AATF/BFR2